MQCHSQRFNIHELRRHPYTQEASVNPLILMENTKHSYHLLLYPTPPFVLCMSLRGQLKSASIYIHHKEQLLSYMISMSLGSGGIARPTVISRLDTLPPFEGSPSEEVSCSTSNFAETSDSKAFLGKRTSL